VLTEFGAELRPLTTDTRYKDRAHMEMKTYERLLSTEMLDVDVPETYVRVEV
jgi:hypothetical protein